MPDSFPHAIDIPTGLGKTKVIAAWLAARAEGAPVPRRLVYVVDRRVVVDQATTEAEELKRELASVLKDESIDAQRRESWRANLGLSEKNHELPVSTLRGQYVDNRRWMDRPHGAAIIVGTVDMIGSRLLFSGYGVNPHTRSVHAGLLGCDSLVILDESHLVPPFERMLDRVGLLREVECARNPLIPAFRVIALSATGRARNAASTFRLDQRDHEDDRVRARLGAEKRLRVLDTIPVSGLAARLAERAWELSADSRRVIVFSNSRKVAQDVESDLAKRVDARYGKGTRRTELFVGERRLRERMRLYDTLATGEPSIVPRFLAKAEDRGDGPVFLVATSAGEVGVDFDADDLVCDLVPWERMVQRFGRVNRRSDPGVATIEVIPSVSEKDAESEIAAERLATALAPFQSTEWRQNDDGSRDASPAELDRLKRVAPFAALIAKAQTPSPYFPALDANFVSAWSLTTLREHTGRATVAPFLRGWTDERPQTSVFWRRRFPMRTGAEFEKHDDVKRELARFFEAAPPHTTELLEAPTDRVAELVKKRAEAYVAVADEEPHPPVVVLLNDRNEVERFLFLSEIRKQKADWLQRSFSGRTIAIDDRLGGLSENGLLDQSAGTAVLTIDGDASVWGLDLKATAQRRIRFGSRENVAGDVDWKSAGYRWQVDSDVDDGDELWVEVFRGEGATHGDAAVTRAAQTLEEHHAWTRDDAERSARALGLPDHKVRMLAAAAAFHDSGKNRSLWQDAMRAKLDGRPYAKTTGGANPMLLAGYRHELGSLADAPRSAELEALPDDDRELALHLISAHHGRSRPTIPAFDPDLPSSRANALITQAALRYARLQEEWGPWGLAWWEAVLRAADWSASRRVDESAASL